MPKAFAQCALKCTKMLKRSNNILRIPNYSVWTLFGSQTYPMPARSTATGCTQLETSILHALLLFTLILRREANAQALLFNCCLRARGVGTLAQGTNDCCSDPCWFPCVLWHELIPSVGQLHRQLCSCITVSLTQEYIPAQLCIHKSSSSASWQAHNHADKR